MKKQHYLALAICLTALVFFTHSVANAQVTFELEQTTVEITPIATNLHVPWEIIWGPDDHIWLTQRDGLVKRLNPETGDITTLLTLPDCFEFSESGLLGMALHPNFEESPYVYIVYNYLSSSNQNLEKLVRYTYNGSILTSPYILLDNITGSTGGGNHSGARIIILPDETLLLTTGDYYNSTIAQNLSSLNGKVLRMTLTGGVPADNPIPNSLVYSWGHRNAQGLVLAPNGILYSSEHGPSNDDELNIIIPNRNYGWPNVEGFCDLAEQSFCDANNVVEPIEAWTPTLAVAGIDYYNHPAIPEWQHSILMTTLKQPGFFQLKLSEDGQSIVEQLPYFNYSFGRVRDICIAPDGRVFISTSNLDGRAPTWAGFPKDEDDQILQIRNPEYVPVTPTAAFQPTADANNCMLFNFVNSSLDADSYTWDFGDGYGSIEANPQHLYTAENLYIVTLIAQNQYTSDTVQTEILVDCGGTATQTLIQPHWQVYPNPVANQEVFITYDAQLAGSVVRLFNLQGNEVWKTTLNNSGAATLQTDLPSGLYWLSLAGNYTNSAKKVFIR